MQLWPNSSTATREFNPCHLPAGTPQGGQFCSDRGGPLAAMTSGHPPAVAQALLKARATLMAASGYEPGIYGKREQDEVTTRETMLAISAQTGEVVGPVIHGQHKAVPLSDENKIEWLRGRPVITAHTHPSGGSFSYDDFRIFNGLNDPELRLEPQPVSAMVVFGSDGSWYEVKFPKFYDEAAMERFTKDFMEAHTFAMDQHITDMDRWLVKELGVTPASRWLDSTERGDYKRAYRKKTGADAEAISEKRWQLALDGLWKDFAQRYRFEYRSYIPQRDMDR